MIDVRYWLALCRVGTFSCLALVGADAVIVVIWARCVSDRTVFIPVKFASGVWGIMQNLSTSLPHLDVTPFELLDHLSPAMIFDRLLTGAGWRQNKDRQMDVSRWSIKRTSLCFFLCLTFLSCVETVTFLQQHLLFAVCVLKNTSCSPFLENQQLWCLHRKHILHTLSCFI